MAGSNEEVGYLRRTPAITRDLHDAVSQQLFAISMMTSAVLEHVKDADDKTVKRIRMVEHMAGEAQNEMRALLLHLLPVTLEGKGLKEVLYGAFGRVPKKAAD